MGASPPRRAAVGRHKTRRALAPRARPPRRPHRTAVAAARGHDVGGGRRQRHHLVVRRLRAGGGLRTRRLHRRLDAGQQRLAFLGAARNHRRDGEAPSSVDPHKRRPAAGLPGRRPAARGRPGPPYREPGARLAARRQRPPRPGDERAAVAAAVRRARLRRLVRVGPRSVVHRRRGARSRV